MKVSLAQAQVLIGKREPFTLRSGNLYAIRGWNGARGFLPDEYLDSITDARYVVISYGTPIAWVTEGMSVVIPDVGYSPTTSQHQYLAAAGLGVEFRPARGRKVVSAGGGPRSGGIDTF